MSRLTAVERMQRILSILPWIVANPGCSVDEVAKRFALERKSLIEDLDFVFYNVGIHPFTPDVLADVYIDDDDQIFVTLGDYFTRPLRLSNAEALTLLTAAKAEMRVDPNHSELLGSAVTKLERSLGIDSQDSFDVRIADADPQILTSVRSAIDHGNSLRIEYYSFGRDHLGERTVEPWEMFTRMGHWYLRAWCHEAQAEREFRLDRIYSAVELETPIASSANGSQSQWTLTERARTVTITGPGPDDSESIDWIARSYPVDSVKTSEDGTVAITLPVATTHWLERLLLRLPTSATAVDADSGEDLSAVRSAASMRILDRYGVM